MSAFFSKTTLVFFLVGLTFSVSAQQFFGQHKIACDHNACEHGLIGVEEDKFTFVPPPASYEPFAPRDAVISVTYNGFTPQAQIAFQYAVDIWASVLNSSQIIKINATYTPLSGSVLGFAGSDGFFRNFGGAPESNTFYPQALANAVANSPVSTDTDVNCTFNANTNWYFGTDGNTPGGQFDFVTVVLHELGHGLGFIGNANVSGGVGTYGLAGDPLIYETFVENGPGVDLTSLSSGTTATGNFITSNDLFWNGMEGMAGAGGTRPRIFAPSSFNGGSSFSHLNEGTYPAGTTNSLMTPFLSSAEAVHDPGAIVLGMFADMAWPIDEGLGCAFTEVEIGTQTPCVSATQTYNQQLIISYQGQPISGFLSVNSSLYTITGSPQTISLNGLPADGLPVDLSISFTLDNACSLSIDDAFVAAEPCPGCSFTSITAGAQGACAPSTGLYTQDVIVEYTLEPSSGSLVVNNQTFPITGSPQTVTLVDLVANGNTVNATVEFSDEPSCQDFAFQLWTAPEDCFVDCSYDLNDDSFVNVSDLLVLLSEIGCEENCSADFNGNGNVNGADLTLFLSQFGNNCQ